MLRLYDTRTRRVEQIVPATPGLLRMYTCGPTVYKPQHVGNLRTFLLSDLIIRVATWHKLDVRFVQNITDVGHLSEDSGEDKMVAEARARGLSALEVAREIEALFHADTRALNIREALAYPRATDYVDKMITLIQRLLEGGHAYVAGGSVFYDAQSFSSYGEVSGNRIADLKPAASGRISDAEEEAKRFHADWALWRGNATPGPEELSFESPWGPGTPGWHIECSTMSLDLLGETIDVHTGAVDLRFPHHEDERAESEAAVGHEVVRHWVHGEHLLFAGKKMAKSTGNVVLLADVVARGHDPLAVRLALLQTRYRTQVNLTWTAIEAADVRLTRWRELVRQWAEAPGAAADAAWVGEVLAAFDDDLDTPRAVALLSTLAKSAQAPAGAKYESFVLVDKLLGLDLMRTVGQPPRALPAGAVELIEEREAARAAKDWPRADELRAALAGLGVTVMDTPEGPVPVVGDAPA